LLLRKPRAVCSRCRRMSRVILGDFQTVHHTTPQKWILFLARISHFIGKSMDCGFDLWRHVVWWVVSNVWEGSTVSPLRQGSARKGPLYADIPYRDFFLFLNFIPALTNICEPGRAVSIVSGWMSGRSRFGPRRRREDFSSSLFVQTGCGTHPPTCPMGRL
jgi:hypothetical protein